METAVREPATKPGGLSGLRKASVVLIALGPDLSAGVLRHLKRDEIERITLEIARVRHVSPEVRDAVLAEFSQMIVAQESIAEGGIEYAQQILQQALGPESATDVISRLMALLELQPFESLKDAEPAHLLQLLRNEHPQTIALVLAHLPPDRAGAVLSGLPAALQAQVAMRIASLDQASPEAVREVEAMLQARLSGAGPQGAGLRGGAGVLAEILTRADRSTERAVLEEMKAHTPEMADEVKKHLFVFEDMATLGRRDVQLVLREVDGKDLALALKGAPDDVRAIVFENMSERAAQALREDMEFLGPVRLRDVEAAQQRIVGVIRTLEEAGEIVIRRGEDDTIL